MSDALAPSMLYNCYINSMHPGPIGPVMILDQRGNLVILPGGALSRETR